MESNARRRVILGPFGSGKSVACCAEIFRRAREQAPSHDGVRRTRWAIVRNTYPDLKNTTVKTWRDWWGDRFGVFSRVAPFVHHLKITLPDDTKLDCEVSLQAALANAANRLSADQFNAQNRLGAQQFNAEQALGADRFNAEQGLAAQQTNAPII